MKKYIIHIENEYLEQMFLQRGCNTDEKKNNLFKTIVEEIATATSNDENMPIFVSSFVGKDGKERKAWHLEEIERGECVKALVDGEVAQEINISYENQWLPAADFFTPSDEKVMTWEKDSGEMRYGCIASYDDDDNVHITDAHGGCDICLPAEKVWWRRVQSPNV